MMASPRSQLVLPVQATLISRLQPWELRQLLASGWIRTVHIRGRLLLDHRDLPAPPAPPRPPGREGRR